MSETSRPDGGNGPDKGGDEVDERPPILLSLAGEEVLDYLVNRTSDIVSKAAKDARKNETTASWAA